MVKLLLAFTALASLAMSSYDADLQRLQKQIEDARAGGDATRIAAATYSRASLTADFAELQAAERAIEEALRISPTPELLLLRANFNFKMHRLQRAKADLARLTDGNNGSEPVKTLAARIALQEGDYAAARAAYTAIVERTHSWDAIASLAYYESVTGNPDGADRLYAAAEDELSAKEMRSYAWVEVQRGVLDFDRGRYAEALVHYQRAERAYSGWWLVEEHTAEVLAALGRNAEAEALYRIAIEQTHNPEYVAALAKLTRQSDAEAMKLYDAQLALYPEAAGGHLIRHLLASPGSDERLLQLAKQNVALRPNGESRLLLAKAYWRAGRVEDARRELRGVRATPFRTPELAAFERAVR